MPLRKAINRQITAVLAIRIWLRRFRLLQGPLPVANVHSQSDWG